MAKNKKRIIIGISIFIILGVAVGGVWALRKKNNEAPLKDPATASSNRGVNDIDYGVDTSNDTSTETAKDQAAKNDQNDTSTGQQPAALGVTITAASQSDDLVLVRATVTGTTSGNCTLRAEMGEQHFEMTAPLAAQANYVICQGFNIPLEKFSQSGTWKVTVSAASGSLSGTASTREVDVQK